MNEEDATHNLIVIDGKKLAFNDKYGTRVEYYPFIIRAFRPHREENTSKE